LQLRCLLCVIKWFRKDKHRITVTSTPLQLKWSRASRNQHLPWIRQNANRGCLFLYYNNLFL